MEINKENSMHYVKVPNNEVFEWLIDLLENLLKKEKIINMDRGIKSFIEDIFNYKINEINQNLNGYLMKLSEYIKNFS